LKVHAFIIEVNASDRYPAGFGPETTMGKRRYDQYCPVAGALDIVGERWALLIVRELLSGSKRFADLEAGLPGVGTATLTTRLAELEDAGIIEKRRLGVPAAATVYALTDWGAELDTVIYALGRWSAPRLGKAAPRYQLRASWLATALSAFYRRETDRRLSATIAVVLPSGTLALRFDRGSLSVTQGDVESCDLRVSATEDDLVAVLSGDKRALKRLRLDGDATLLDRLIAAFPLKIAPAD
jgi:DNA-binding HxlR family transcriptional regulator